MSLPGPGHQESRTILLTIKSLHVHNQRHLSVRSTCVPVCLTAVFHIMRNGGTGISLACQDRLLFSTLASLILQQVTGVRCAFFFIHRCFMSSVCRLQPPQWLRNTSDLPEIVFQANFPDRFACLYTNGSIFLFAHQKSTRRASCTCRWRPVHRSCGLSTESTSLVCPGWHQAQEEEGNTP